MQGRGTVTVGPDGEPTGSIGCVTDITDLVLDRQRTEGAARQLAALAEASVAIASSLSLAEVIDHVTAAGRRIIRCERVDIVTSAQPAPGTLVAPLTQRDGSPLGALRCTGITDGEPSAEDEAVLVQLAHMASAAIENARLYEAEQRARRRTDELSETLQAGLLPTLGRHGGVQVSSRYRPGEERLLLGGDFVDAVATPRGLLGFCIGDVSGRGKVADVALGAEVERPCERDEHDVVAAHLTESLQHLRRGREVVDDNDLDVGIAGILDDGPHRLDRPAGGTQRGFEAAGRHARVGIQLADPHLRRRLADHFDIGPGVHPLQVGGRRLRRLAPIQVEARVVERIHDRLQPRRPLGVASAGVMVQHGGMGEQEQRH